MNLLTKNRFNFLYLLNLENYQINFHKNAHYYKFINGFLSDKLNLGNLYDNTLYYELNKNQLNYNSFLENILSFQKNTIYIYIYLYIFILINFYNNNLIIFNIISLFYSVVTEFERELNSIDDLIYILTFFIFFFFFSLIFISGFTFFYRYNIILLSILLNMKIILIFISTFFLLEFGFFFLIYLRGASKSSSILYEILQDYLYIISYFFRIVVQFIRVIFYFFYLYQINELFVEYYYYFWFFINNGTYLYKSNIFINSLYFILIIIFELGHQLLSIIIQFVAFNGIIL